MAKQTAVDARYNLLSGNIRRRQEKESNLEDLFTVLNTGLAFGQAKLRKNRKNFNENADIMAAKVNQQEALSLRDNVINPLVDAGNKFAGGLGEYLVQQQIPIVTKKFNDNIKDESIYTSDSQTRYIESLARDAVYGEFKLDANGNKTTERDTTKGLLHSVTNLYEQGKNLRSMDQYKEYLRENIKEIQLLLKQLLMLFKKV